MRKYFKEKLKKRFPNLYISYLSYLGIIRDRKIPKIVTKMGFSFIGMKSMQDGTFEEEETEIIINALKETDLFVDIGANVGYYSCIANNCGVKTISVEPLAENLKILYSNLQSNGWDSAEVFPVGLGEKPMIIDLYGENTGASIISNWAGNLNVLKRTIAISTLDIILGQRFMSERLFIKIDVEGYEYEVLKGATSVLSRFPKPIWLIEICFTELFPEGFNPNYLNTFELFWEYGYEAFTADIEERIVKKEDVERWIKNKKRDFGYANFLFKQSNNI